MEYQINDDSINKTYAPVVKNAEIVEPVQKPANHLEYKLETAESLEIKLESAKVVKFKLETAKIVDSKLDSADILYPLIIETEVEVLQEDDQFLDKDGKYKRLI